MNLILLIIGTVLSILFIIMMFAGSKYDYMLESLEGDEFPCKSIYAVGLKWQDFRFAHLKGKAGEYLRNNTQMIYSQKYSEFYSRIIWAQILTFSHLILALFFLLAGMTSGSTSTFYFAVGVVVTMLAVYYFYSLSGEKLKKRREICEEEFPNVISKLTLIVNSGVILHESWEMVSYGKEGEIYDLMKKSCVEMNNGKSEIDALYEFGIMTNSDSIKKFVSALIQSIERGGADLPQFLANQSSELWSEKRQLLLQKGEKAAGGLLMPIAIMFVGIMLIVMSSAIQSFSI